MSGYCSIPDCARLGEENGLCERHDRVRLQRELAAANLDNARKTYEVNRLVGERAAERERADIAEALATVRELEADRMRQRAEEAEAALAEARRDTERIEWLIGRQWVSRAAIDEARR